MKMGNIRILLAAGTALMALGISAGAQAYEAFVARPAALLAGPSPDYPPVLNFNGGEPVEVYGCLQDYSWCDISFQDYRGWFEADLLAYPYEGQRVPLYEYGYRIGVPVIGFSFDDYWGRYYYNRPFFRERERWARLPPPHFEERHFEGPRFEGRPNYNGEHFDGRPGYGPNRGPGPGAYSEPEHREGEHGPGEQPRPQGQPQPPRPQPQQGQRPPQQQQQQRPPQQAQGQRPAAPAAANPAAAPHPQTPPPKPAEQHPHPEGEHREEQPHQ
jgi:uncharacterized protein YraI